MDGDDYMVGDEEYDLVRNTFFNGFFLFEPLR